jgi:hypothetical protein
MAKAQEEQTQETATETATEETKADDFDHREALLEGQTEEAAEATSEGGTEEEAATSSSESATPEGVTEEASQEEEPKTEDPGFLGALRELGWQGDDVEQAQSALLDAFRTQSEDLSRYEERLAEAEELAKYGTQFLKDQREREEAEAKTKAAPTEGGPEPWWNPPQFDPATFEQYRDVTVDENGQPTIGWKKGTPREIVDNAERYQQYLEGWAEDLVRRPQEVLPKIIEQEFDRLFEERITAREQESQMESFAEEVKAQNQDWMYTTDTRGNQVLSPEGQVMTQLLQEVAEDGIADPRRQWDYAVARYDYLNRSKTGEEEQASNEAADTREQKKQEHLAKGRGKKAPQNRTGTITKPEEGEGRPQNANQSPGHQLLDALREQGVEF